MFRATGGAHGPGQCLLKNIEERWVGRQKLSAKTGVEVEFLGILWSWEGVRILLSDEEQQSQIVKPPNRQIMRQVVYKIAGKLMWFYRARKENLSSKGQAAVIGIFSRLAPRSWAEHWRDQVELAEEE